MKTKYKVIIYILAALAAGFVAFVNLRNESDRNFVCYNEQQEERFEIVRDTIIVDNIDTLPCIIDSIKL
jgi:hypothetical protein